MKIVTGWREVVSLPGLGIESIRAKVDTGAKTCALHACFIDEFLRDQQLWVRFGVHPRRNREDLLVECEARVSDRRSVMNSGGGREFRYVIMTEVWLGSLRQCAEITLANREDLSYRMLLGRNFLRGTCLVDSELSYVLGKKPPRRSGEMK